MRRAVLALLLAGCSYDWTVSATPPSDSGHDAPPSDAPLSDDSPVDAVAEPPLDASPTDSTTGSDADASPPDAAGCQQLLQTAKNALPPALVCVPTMPNVCTAQAQDWCGCPVYLADGTSTAYMDFVNAVTAFDSASCRSTIFCADTCPAASSGICVVSDAAAMYACYQ